MNDLTDAARGRWPEILSTLAGLTAEQLSDTHQPCPLCGGTDRYRFDDKDGSGSWFCNQCGGKHQSGGAGNGMDLLMRKTGWDFPTAARRIEQHLGLRTVQTVQISDPPTRGAESVWRYSSTFYVCRFPGKKIRPLSWDGQQWRWKAPPSSRPLLNLDQLTARADAKVLVVEGEKAADAAARLFPSLVVTTWPSGCKATDKADWSPLRGRAVTLWPDNDEVGRAAVARIAVRLMAIGCSIKVINPPDNLPEGWDVADATDWDTDAATNFVRDHIQAIQDGQSILGIEVPSEDVQPPLPDQPVTAPEPPPIRPASGGYFTPLGFDADGYYYQPHGTGQVVRLSRSSHTGTNLVALAPLCYWESLYYGKSGPNWTAAASDLFAQQAAVGVYSPDRIRGRGAWWDQGRAILHLGDRLLVDGEEHHITNRLPGSPYLYQRLAAIDGLTGITPLTDNESFPILDIAARFHWEVPASGLLIAGWATLAPICGALEWRPHVWLTAGSGSGKSTLLDSFLGPLLGPIGLWPEGATTEASIRQELRADAIPVVFDEAESNEKADQVRIQAILALARVASSSGRGFIGKGSSDGTSQRFTIRSMFLLSSISTALKQGADKSRFAQLTLINPNHIPKPERTAHWQDLKRDLEKYITDEIGRRLMMRTIGLIPVIRESTKVFRRAAADHFDSQRLGDQYGTLLAGAWSLMASTVPTIDEALGLIRSNDWEPYQQATEVPDEVRCIQTILQHQLRVELDHSTVTRTIGELVAIAGGEPAWQIASNMAEATLGRHGLKVEDDCLLISNTAQAIARILADTAWSFSWATILARLPGATKAGVVRFKGLGATSRAVRVPLDSL